MNTRERLAKAMIDARVIAGSMTTTGSRPLFWDEMPDAWRQWALADVDAILAKLRDFDDAMLEAARGFGVGPRTAALMFEAMIDAARKP